jgi:hypothetical protein
MIALSRALQQCALTLGGHDQAMGIYESAANNPGIVSRHTRHADPVFITALPTARTTQDRAGTIANKIGMPAEAVALVCRASLPNPGPCLSRLPSVDFGAS